MARKPRPGDGKVLPRYRWWQVFSRSLFHLNRSGPDGAVEVWSVDVRHGGDADGEVWARLYRDGRNEARSKLPAAFPLADGVLQVAASAYGMKRCRFVAQDGSTRTLTPDPASAEGLRARLDRTHPALSRSIGAASVAILVVALVLGAPQIAEDITRIPIVADRVGTFVSPIQLPFWANISLLLATIAASSERALRLRYSWILDGGAFDGDV
ncbi:hypothetical protein [Microbacterium halophytorum]|uniref:hypothetical protein n=1 Tax=Microbacterium halophytorum TaxID=2067568 RepID=UPI000CFE19AF|nr:hypothetical protein [Microbacterium halophytorum]